MQPGAQPRGKLGIGGEFRIVQQKARTAADKVDFLDLWEHRINEHGVPVMNRDKNGDLIPNLLDSEVLCERRFHNKFTKRALSRMLHEILLGHNDGPYIPSEVVSGDSVNPFLAFFMASDDTVNAKVGDFRPEFDESDGAFDAAISPDSATIGEGKRALLLSTTAGILKLISSTYRSTTPYGEAEFVFYAQPNSPAVETGLDGIDNFPIKAVGLAAGTDCGDGEANNKIGIRAIVGLSPTFQGVTDTPWVHEGQQQGEDLVDNEYPDDQLPGGAAASAAGYIQNSKQTEVQIDASTTSGGAGDTITAATRTIVLANAVAALSSTSGFLASAHVRKVLRIAGSGVGTNNRDFTIQEVLSPTSVKVFEAPGGDDAGGTNPFTAGVWTVYEGHNAFDGRVENEGRIEVTDTGSVPVPSDPPGTVVLGEKWSSVDATGTHMVGRVFAVNKTLAGIRIVVPAGVNKDFAPDNFVIEILDPAANGGSPRPGYDLDWTSVSVQAAQATNIFDAGIYGYEYTFTPVSARGVRLNGMQAFSPTRKVEIAQIMAYAPPSLVAMSGEKIRLKTKGPSPFRTFSPPDVASPTSVAQLRDSLNEVLRGYELEAKRSTFGYLWIRSTVAGDNSDVWLDAEGPEGTNSNLGLPAGATQRTGITQPVTKAPADALTIIYRVNITGNVPGGWE